MQRQQIGNSIHMPTSTNPQSVVDRSFSTLPTRLVRELRATRMESEVQSHNEYEELRKKRIAENNAKLESLGIYNHIRCVVCEIAVGSWRDMQAGRLGDQALNPTWLLLCRRNDVDGCAG